jgi:hypothetical protein
MSGFDDLEDMANREMFPEPRTVPEIDPEVGELIQAVKDEAEYGEGLYGVTYHAQSISRRLSAQSADSVTVDREVVFAAVVSGVMAFLRANPDVSIKYVDRLDKFVTDAVIAAMGQEPGENNS